MSSRLTSEARMPSVPMVSPSEIAMVLNSMGRAARGANAFLHFGGETPEVKVAGHGFDPGIGDADERFAQIVVGETDGFEHGTRRSPGRVRR